MSNTHTTITAPRKRSAKTVGVAAAGALLLPAVGTFSFWHADAGLGSGLEGITAGLLDAPLPAPVSPPPRPHSRAAR